jgi:hypothetical protein
VEPRKEEEEEEDSETPARAALLGTSFHIAGYKARA